MIQTLDLDYTQVFSELGRHCRYIKSWVFFMSVGSYHRKYVAHIKTGGHSESMRNRSDFRNYSYDIVHR